MEEITGGGRWVEVADEALGYEVVAVIDAYEQLKRFNVLTQGRFADGRYARAHIRWSVGRYLGTGPVTGLNGGLPTLQRAFEVIIRTSRDPSREFNSLSRMIPAFVSLVDTGIVEKDQVGRSLSEILETETKRCQHKRDLEKSAVTRLIKALGGTLDRK